MVNNRASITEFAQRQEIRLLRDAQAGTPRHVTKAGILPYMPGNTREDMQFYVFKPKPKRIELGEPNYQICKGTRMMQFEGSWRDIPDTVTPASTMPLEPLIETALREGQEELGLKLENISALHDLGSYSFTSEKTGQMKWMWLYAARMYRHRDFTADAAVAEYTESRLWSTYTQFRTLGRADHIAIISDVLPMLAQLQSR